MICIDFRYSNRIPTDNADFFIWIYHFTEENYPRKLPALKKFVRNRHLPVIVSSPVSDENIGFNTYIDKDKVISLSKYEGILEVNL